MGICLVTSYGAGIDDAKARMKRGEKQHYCFDTGLWEWPDRKCNCNPKILTDKALARYAKVIAGATVGLAEKITRTTKPEGGRG